MVRKKGKINKKKNKREVREREQEKLNNLTNTSNIFSTPLLPKKIWLKK